uniref:Ricin B lectin domain-containing protein n=1 Tax=Trieres chinensis TaxID=1514140 RepID=A0A7S2EFJ2_TRICV|mmetsp:Transcript_21541/g.43528  ORF Transcript_21541/g.43528 Transcript_21541/m.43528 type:complete len:197 (+) Transcript_21541:146-736(+)
MKYHLALCFVSLTLLITGGEARIKVFESPEEERKLDEDPDRGGVVDCGVGGGSEYNQYLFPGEYFERGQGLCVSENKENPNHWTFGLTKGKGKLQLIKTSKIDGSAQVKWKAKDDEGNAVEADFCRLNKGGRLVCYQGSRHGGSDMRNAVWEENCAYNLTRLALESGNGKVIRLLGIGRTYWWVNKEGEEGRNMNC